MDFRSGQQLAIVVGSGKNDQPDQSTDEKTGKYWTPGAGKYCTACAILGLVAAANVTIGIMLPTKSGANVESKEFTLCFYIGLLFAVLFAAGLARVRAAFVVGAYILAVDAGLSLIAGLVFFFTPGFNFFLFSAWIKYYFFRALMDVVGD